MSEPAGWQWIEAWRNGTISDKDFELAAMIEQWVCWRPDADSALEGAPLEGNWRYLVAP